MAIRILLIHPVTNFKHFLLLPFDGKPAPAAAGPGSCSPPARWKSNFPFVLPFYLLSVLAARVMFRSLSV